MGRRFRSKTSSRARRWGGRDKRLQRAGSRIEYPVKPVARCAGCLGDIHEGDSKVRSGELVFCSTGCLARGRHWVDPSLCGGCGGEHRLGVRP